MYWPASTHDDSEPRGWFGDTRFPQVARYTNRVSYLLSNGKPAADIAVYYPTDSEWLGDQMADSSALHLCQMLLENQHDFDFIDDYAILNVLESKRNGLQNLSGQIYNTILIPSVKAMPKTVLDKLKSFAVSGVKVVFTEKQPSLIVGQTFRDAGNSYNFDWAISEPNNLFRQLPEPDFKLDPASDSIKYNHRKFADGDLYFIFNEGNSTVKTNLELLGKGQPQVWDANSGEIKSVEPVKKTGNHVRMNLNLSPWETQIIVISNNKKKF